MLDDLDRRLLRYWQAEPDLSPSDLAERAGVTPGKAMRRIVRMQDEGVIEGVCAVVDWAAMAQIGLIMEHGCRVFVTKPPFDHTKLTLVDDIWALVGSTNWDPRSLRLNFEFNVECYHPHLSEQLHAIVDAKAEGCREIKLQELDDRALPIKLRDGLARLLSPYL